MSVVPSNASQPIEAKLEYLQEFRLLLCTTCEYCVLPEALDRHLKYIHHLHVRARTRYNEEIREWDLVDITKIKYPDPEHSPIRGLPIIDGYACAAPHCGHLCATTKRMQAHWREQHPRLRRCLATKDGYQCSSVHMQTFFRSSNLRYFVVRSTRSEPVSSGVDEVGATDLHAWSPLVKGVGIDDGLSNTEWMLVRQFGQVSYTALFPVKGSRPGWRDQIIQICSQSPYMKFAVLSLAASHVAYTRVDCRKLYGMEADRYRRLAIGQFPVRSTTIQADLFFQVFNFQRLMTACCLARMQLAFLEDKDAYLESTSVIPDWILVQRSGNALVWPLRGQHRIVDALQASVPRLFTLERLATLDANNSCNPCDAYLEELSQDLRRMTMVDVAIDECCLETLDMLRKVWALPYKESVAGFRDMALRFTNKAPQRFFDLIAEHHPAALVVFAYFTVLWSLGEEVYWYMQGHAEAMLIQIIKCLPPGWKKWVAWPVSMILERR